MYWAQMQKIKDCLNKIWAASAKSDNYQGDENDITILSLVRSNNDNRLGFLDVKNRIFVALIRK